MTALQICSSYFNTSLFKCLFSKLEALGVKNYVYVPRYFPEEENTKDHIFVINKRFSRWAKFLYWGEQRYILQDIEKRINLKEIDVIHVHRILYGGYAALQLKKKYNIPYIVAIRNSDLYATGRNMSRFRNHCLQILLNAEKVVFISNAYKEKVWHNYSKETAINQLKGQSVTLTNGIDDYFLESIASKGSHRPGNGEIRLFALGTIDQRKNQITTLKACDILIERGYQVLFYFAGKNYDQKLFSEIRGKAYSRYLGQLSKEQVREQLLNSDILVVPSIHETFGLVYAEAMSQGVPVIYTRGQGFDGQYDEGEVGFSVDCFNENEIADCILKILSDYQNISDRCIDYAKRYSWQSIAEKYKDTYLKCLREGVNG